MLKNRKYIGEYRYRDVVIPNGVPAIVDEALFGRVQERLEKKKKAPARFKAKEERYLLTTKLFCGTDKVFIVGESGTSRNGNVHRYYKCVTAKNRKGRKRKPVKKDWIEREVIDRTIKWLYDDAWIDEAASKILALQQEESSALPFLIRGA